MYYRGHSGHPRFCEYIQSSDPEDGDECSDLAETTSWPKKRMCRPCFWLTFPEESWALHRAWQMAHDEWDDNETKVRKFGFNDDRFANLCRVKHPALSVLDEPHEVLEMLLEMTGFANQPRVIEQSEWQKK